MANLKNINDLPVAESAEGLNLIVNDNGSAKQIPANKVGKVKTVNGVSPDTNGNIQIDTASSWNDLKDKPAKLSEFENDLFYSKRESFLKLTPANFTEADGMYMYDSGQPALDWLTGADKLGYHIVVNSNGEIIDLTEDEGPVIDGSAMGLPAESASTVFVCGEAAVISNGFSEFGPNFMVSVSAEVITVAESIELFQIETKRIQAKYLDVDITPAMEAAGNAQTAAEAAQNAVNAVPKCVQLGNSYMIEPSQNSQLAVGDSTLVSLYNDGYVDYISNYPLGSCFMTHFVYYNDEGEKISESVTLTKNHSHKLTGVAWISYKVAMPQCYVIEIGNSSGSSKILRVA